MNWLEALEKHTVIPAFGTWGLAFVQQADASGNEVGISAWNKADTVSQ